METKKKNESPTAKRIRVCLCVTDCLTVRPDVSESETTGLIDVESTVLTVPDGHEKLIDMRFFFIFLYHMQA